MTTSRSPLMAEITGRLENFAALAAERQLASAPGPLTSRLTEFDPGIGRGATVGSSRQCGIHQ